MSFKAVVFLSASLCAGVALAAETPPRPQRQAPAQAESPANASPDQGVLFTPESVASEGSVNVEGQRIDYRAVAGTLIVHPKGWDDAAKTPREALGDRTDTYNDNERRNGEPENPKAEASMFYVAYFKKGVPSADRPITFLYNGGPGSSTVWLHMGAFGPRRVRTADDAHTPAAPYTVVDNTYSLLDASDLVFIDMPGAGFSRIAGKDKEKAFWGADPDAYAFSQFILGFLSKYGRWNSPKYLFGESYGTPRTAMVVNELTTRHDVDFNGVVMLSQILNFGLSVDGADISPGSDEPYITALPTYAATAWYHHRISNPPASLEALLHEVEQFSLTEYALALQAGSVLSDADRQAVAEKLARYTGLPVDYVLKADLRITGGMFEKMLQDPSGLTTGRIDTRFSGPSLDPLSKEAEYDPQSAAVSSAYVAAFNDYVRGTLHYGGERAFKPSVDVFKSWSFAHTPPGADQAFPGALNVLPDLANTMKVNPLMKVMVGGGYYDLATPFFEGWYEMHHLPMPKSLQANIEYHYYPSGHMVYNHEESMKALHDDVAGFIRRTDNLAK